MTRFWLNVLSIIPLQQRMSKEPEVPKTFQMDTMSLNTGVYTLFEGSNSVYWGVMEEKEQLVVHLLRLDNKDGS